MDAPLRFCLRSVTPEERRALEALDPPARPHDCLSACTDCFHGPVLARGDARVADGDATELIRRGRDACAKDPGRPIT
ncbi:MAG: hypothetical protein DHS20C14_05250 [Phycisphaeraceae bacterium]|nr:MAG: hypothetical protein DHS20C14_05250 [Phycisphaeraceae bacterium]